MAAVMVIIIIIIFIILSLWLSAFVTGSNFQANGSGQSCKVTPQRGQFIFRDHQPLATVLRREQCNHQTLGGFLAFLVHHAKAAL